MANIKAVKPLTIVYRRKVRAKTLDQMWKVMEQAGEFTVQSIIDTTSLTNIIINRSEPTGEVIKMVEVDTRDYSTESMKVLDVDFVIKTNTKALRDFPDGYLEVTRLVYEVFTDDFLTSTVTNGQINYMEVNIGKIDGLVTFNLECTKINAKIVKKLDNSAFLEFGTGIYEDSNGINVFAFKEGWGRVPFIKKEYAEIMDDLCKPFVEKKIAPKTLYGVLEIMVEKYPESKPEDLAYVVEWWRMNQYNKINSTGDGGFAKMWHDAISNNNVHTNIQATKLKNYGTSSGRWVGKSRAMLKKGTDWDSFLEQKD